MRVRVRLLGPVDVLVDGTPRPVHGLRRKAVLAALALQPGVVVSSDRLIDVVWGDAAPATAATTLQSHVSRLRRVLGGGAAVLARPPGYVLEVAPGDTDVQAAERLLRQAVRSADPGQRESQLRAVVALWRGQPLADLAGLGWFDDQAQRLEQLLVQARHALIDARMALGQHAQVIPELESVCRQQPLHEQTHAQLMLALYRAGRQGDAFAAYQRLRQTLDEELGIGPSQPLRDLETAILRQDPTLEASASPAPAAAPPAAAPPAAANGTAPAQLPPGVAAFTGRRSELAQLDGLLVAGGDDDAHDARATGSASAVRPAAMAIAAISDPHGRWPPRRMRMVAPGPARLSLVR